MNNISFSACSFKEIGLLITIIIIIIIIMGTQAIYVVVVFPLIRFRIQRLASPSLTWDIQLSVVSTS